MSHDNKIRIHQPSRRRKMTGRRCLQVLLLFTVVLGLFYLFNVQKWLVSVTAMNTKASSFYHDNRVPVYNFPPDMRGQAEVGLRYSKRLVEATDPDQDKVVWAINYIRIRSRNKCDTIIKLVKESIARRTRTRRRRAILLGGGARPATVEWPLLLYDYSDKTKPITSCVRTLASLLGGRQNVKYARRSLVDGRDFSCFRRRACFNETLPLRDFYGHASNYSSTGDLSKYIHNGVIAKFHIQVRSDLLRELGRQYHSQNKNQSSFRTGDVAHFWNIQPGIEAGTLRNRVSEAILSLQKECDKNISVLADTVSPRSVVGRNSVATAYVQALLEYKIVVVCQRDNWEDHFRLLEGMISGALVLSDPMIHMPVGYKHGVNIVVYESIADMKSKILYYLEHTAERVEIARAGRHLALAQHRPWHRMERFILGQWPASSEDPVIPMLQ